MDCAACFIQFLINQSHMIFIQENITEFIIFCFTAMLAYWEVNVWMLANKNEERGFIA